MTSKNIVKADLSHLSRVITALRFPLIVLVVLVHVPLSEDISRVLTPSDLFGDKGMYYYISKVISFTLGHAAVPAFFFFSGYYFFFKEQNLLDPKVYRGLLLKRIGTLFLPYVIWSVLPFMLEVFRGYLLGAMSISDLSPWHHILRSIFLENTYNFPLWYLKDLIVFTLLSPLIYLVAKRYCYIVILIFVLYIANVNVVVTSRGLFFFVLGAVLGMRHIDPLQYIAPYSRLIYTCTLLATFLLPFTVGLSYHAQLIYAYVPFVVSSMLLVVSDLSKSQPLWIERLQSLAPSVFFIYVIHIILVLVVRGRFYALGVFETVYGYFLISTFVLLLSWFLYFLLKTYAPKLFQVLVGGRA